MHYQGYLIDLDGTVYRGSERIPGAKECIDFLIENGIPYLFITNNSSNPPEQVAQKLNKMGIQATAEQIITSAYATATYIKRFQDHPRVYVVGEAGLKQTLENNDCIITSEQADIVVVGIDREINYEKIAQASLFIQQGATFLSTNKDPAIPTERGLLPGNGAITAAIRSASGKSPIFIGKPEAIIMEEALRNMNLNREQVLMVGDNYQTDILAGIRSNIDTLMVLTGYSSIDDIQQEIQQPTYIENNLLDWIE